MRLQPTSAFFKYAALASFLLGACAPLPKLHSDSSGSENTINTEFQLVYVIHGDADYLFHDSHGKRFMADAEAIKQGLNVALSSKRGEVFIFHQKPIAKFFSRSPDGVFYHYRFGELLHKQEYFRNEFRSNFGAEVELFQHYSSPTMVRFFVYFGHEIPENVGVGYSASHPSHNFSLPEFSRGVRDFNKSDYGKKKPFDLIVLSTCRGGSKAMMSALTPLTTFVIASPSVLHLSFFDTHAFQNFSHNDTASSDKLELHQLAQTLSEQSFTRLKSFTQTEITVAIHDLRLEPNTCIELLYQPPRFGAHKHSIGSVKWECPKH